MSPSDDGCNLSWSSYGHIDPVNAVGTLATPSLDLLNPWRSSSAILPSVKQVSWSLGSTKTNVGADNLLAEMNRGEAAGLDASLSPGTVNEAGSSNGAVGDEVTNRHVTENTECLYNELGPPCHRCLPLPMTLQH